MTSKDFFTRFIDASCNKIYPSTYEDYIKIKEQTTPVGANTLYTIYTSLVDNVDRDTFYKEAKKHLYYDKYICDHGVEFYYLVSITQQEQTPLVMGMIMNNTPSKLDDIRLIINAVYKEDHYDKM